MNAHLVCFKWEMPFKVLNSGKAIQISSNYTVLNGLPYHQLTSSRRFPLLPFLPKCEKG